MRKPTFAEAYMYKNFLWLAIGAFAFIPFLNNLILQFLYLYTEGDIAYGSLGIFLSAVKSVLSAASVYIGLGVLIVSVINFGKNAVGIIRLAFLSHVIAFVSAAITCTLYSNISYGYLFTGDVLIQIIMLAVDTAVNLAVYLAIYIVLIKITKKKETVLSTPSIKGRYTDIHHPIVLATVISVSVHLFAQLLTVLYSMISAFTDPSIGPPVNSSDILYWILQYLSAVAFDALGLVIIILVAFLSEHYIKSGKKKKSGV